MRHSLTETTGKVSNEENGGALLAALILVAISGIMGAAILFATSTDLQISGNYRRAVQSLYAAEAGLAETQRRLAGVPNTQLWFVGDPSGIPQSNWSAYVLTSASWQPLADPGYSTTWTNYVPVQGNLTNTVILSNSIQTALSYWSKVQHKTEYDAEQAGHSLSVPHYVDGDGMVTTHTKINRGQLIRFGYFHSSSIQPGQFSSSNHSLYPPVDIIRSHGEVEGAVSIIQGEVAHHPGPPIWAPVYVGNHLGLLGGSITIQGQDTCGMLTEGYPPVMLSPTATLLGTATLTGNPASPQVGSAALDMARHLENLKTGGQLIPGDLNGVTLGMPGSPAVQVAQPAQGPLTLTNVIGYGFLLVDGSLRIHPPFRWEGLIIVTGQVTVEAGLSPVLIRGALLADTIQILNDTVTIALDACPIAATLPLLPVKVLHWRQVL